MLALRLGAGEFEDFQFEGITLLLGEGTRYTPDFTIWEHDGTLRFIEVKGPYIREDSLVKFKCAIHRFPLASWELWQLNKGEWTPLLCQNSRKS